MIDAGPNAGTATGVLVPARRTRWLAWLGVALAVIAVYPLAIILANPLLTVRDPLGKADVIVVLGGDGPPRAAWTANLWLEGAAPRILVSGDGDCTSIRRTMIDDGVPAGAITLECMSGSTWENALFSAPILREMDARRAILVTSWFHSRRAIDRFIATSGQVEWSSVPVEPKKSLWDLALDADGIQILKEYPKTAWYALRAPFQTPKNVSGLAALKEATA